MRTHSIYLYAVTGAGMGTLHGEFDQIQNASLKKQGRYIVINYQTF